MRNKKDQDQQQPLSAVRPAPQNAKKAPRHMDLLEAASQTDLSSLRKPSPRPDQMDMGSGKENAVVSMRSKPRAKPYNGDVSYRHQAHKNYMMQAFGLESLRASKNGTPMIEPPRRPCVDHRPDSEVSAVTTDSMEVNFHIAPDIYGTSSSSSSRHLRPKIQVQIPGKSPMRRQPSSSHLAAQIDRQKKKRNLRQSITLPSGDADLPTMSVVSPLSVVEMPKPRRPFSAMSLEDMTKTEGHLATKPTVQRSESDESSYKSDDIFTTTLTRRSSMSSLTSVKTVQKPVSRRHSIAFSIADPVAAGVFDAVPPVPKIAKNLRSMRSTASLAPDTNKPLPPEPGMEEVRPLRVASQSYSRGSDLHPKRKAPSPLTISRSSTISTIQPSRMSTLRSRYTPADLDALDAAFVKSSPQVGNFGHTRESSWEQAQSALEEHLDTIAEDDAASLLTVPLACDPLQISRMTNSMVPTRQAPAPPAAASSASSIKTSDGSVSNMKRFYKHSSKHVVLQMKADRSSSGSDSRRRISAPVSVQSNPAKAYKILGRTDQPDFLVSESVQMERGFSSDSYGSSSSPDHSYNGDSSSPSMSNRGDTTTPETDISSIPDAAFEEIKTRLELLSPQRDSHNHFAGWNKQVNSPIQEESAATTRPHTSGKEAVDSLEIRFDEENYSVMLEGALPPAYFPSPKNTDELMPPRSMREIMHERPRSLASIAASEIPDIYASLPYSDVADMEERSISADAAEIVLLRILEHLDNLQDLFATATVSRGFYRTFKRHELALMKNALYGMSPAAWELREVTQPYPGLQDGAQSPILDYSPSLYLQHYMRDMYTMIALKSMILLHCESFLRADTITALAGGETERASQIDDAFWRVWTFCQIFGCGSGREEDIVAQMDWLRGGPVAKQDKRNHVKRQSLVSAPTCTFGYGNAGGLSAGELYDMTEIWTCMGVLVRGFQGKRQEAREYGIFANATDLTEGDIEAEDKLLEEWTYHLLTLAPPTVLDVTSPTSPTATTFARAKAQGYTAWTPPTVSRATFLKEAVSRIYQERISEMQAALTSSVSSAPTSPTRSTSLNPEAAAVVTRSRSTSNSSTDSTQQQETIAARWRCARHAAEIRAKRSEPGFSDLPASEDRPMSEFPSVLERLDLEDAPPVPSLPTSSTNGTASSSSHSANPSLSTSNPTAIETSTSTSSTSSHKASNSLSDTAKTVISALVVPRGPQVKDPVDDALERLVSMGFESKKAKKALAESDTGDCVCFDVALEKLVRERKRDVEGLMHSGYRGRVGQQAQEEKKVVGMGKSEGAVAERRRRFEELSSPPPPLERFRGPKGCGAQRESFGVGLGIGGVNV